MFGKTIFAVLALAALGAIYFSTSEVKNYEGEFQNFVSEYRRSYFSKDEYSMRLAVFTENVKKIDAMNANPEDQAVYGINNFADWTHEEFMKLNSLPELTEADKAALPKPDLTYAVPKG